MKDLTSYFEIGLKKIFFNILIYKLDKKRQLAKQERIRIKLEQFWQLLHYKL